MPSRLSASLIVFPSSRDPDTITELLGLEPTRLWKKGDKYHGKYFHAESREVRFKVRERPKSLWELSSRDTIQSEFIHDHVEYLLSVVEPNAKQLRQLLEDDKEYFVRVTLWLEAIAGHMSISVSSEEMLRICNICHDIHMAFISLEDE